MTTPNMRTAVDRAFDAFQHATVLLGEDNRPAAAEELRAAIRTVEGHTDAEDLRHVLEQLLASTTRCAS